MELRVLRYFLAVAREENITAASKILHITQPTLSKQLMDLEDELGKKLFIRGNRRIALTEEGMFLRKRAQEIVELAEKTEKELKSDEDIISGDVYIGGGETNAMLYIANALKHLHKDCPNIKFHLYSGNGQDVAERLDKGLIDFGLFVVETDLKKYEYFKLPSYNTWGLLLLKEDPLSKNDVIHPDDLENIPILCSRQALIQNELSGWLGYSLENLNIVGTYNLVYNASLMVEKGLGSALCIDGLINTSGNSKLCFKPFKPEIHANLYMVWKKYQVFSKAAEKFLNVLLQECS